MKFGFTLPSRGQLATPDKLGFIAKKAEELGFDALLAGDHIIVPRDISSIYPYTEGGEFPGAGWGDWLEQIALLSYIAGQTTRIRLATSVLIVPYRNPLVSAKSLATLDILSKGRLVVGVGVGWMQEEFQALDAPPFEERGSVTDEYLRAFKVLWTEEEPRFEGKYLNFDNINFLPKPEQKPHPPIWVGGESRPAMRRAAELADGWYPLGSNPTFPMGTPDQLKAGLDRLAQYAERFGRDPSAIDTIYRTHQAELKKESGGKDRMLFVGNGEEIVEDVQKYQDIGVTSMIWDFLRRTDDFDSVLEQMEDFANQVMTNI